jgi:hypothetical protein
MTTKYPKIKWQTDLDGHGQPNCWGAKLGSVYVNVHYLPRNGDRLFVTASDLLTNEDLWNQADSDASIEAALDEAIGLIREAVLERLLELKRELFMMKPIVMGCV